MELDYMVIADYVRSDNGVVSIMAAGIDTIHAAIVPTVQPLGVAIRMLFDSNDAVSAPHRFSLRFVSVDGQQHLYVNGSFAAPPQPPGVPEHWMRNVGIALQIPVPIPTYGDFAFELDIDNGSITKSIDFRVVPAAPRPGPVLIPPPLV